MPTRKRSLWLVVLSFTLWDFGGAATWAEQTPSDRPNIILIMSDDMGYSDVGCYGGEIQTPHLERLAQNGLRYRQFYNNARCCPTRATLLTGLYPHQAGIGHMEGDYGLDGYRGDLKANCPTFAESLRSAGYATFLSGKWHVTRFRGEDGPKHNWPLQRGFERFYGTITGAGSFFDPTTLCRGNRYITPVNDPDYRPRTFYYTDAISDNAVTFLDDHVQQSPEQPFLLYLSYTTAHWPMHALPHDIKKYEGAYDGGYVVTRQKRLDRMKHLGLIDASWKIPPLVEDWSKTEHPKWEADLMEVYAAMVDNMDQGIGRVVECLRRHDKLDNTIIMYFQDNGACAENSGRRNANQPYPDYHPMGPDELQSRIWPPMQTRDGRAVRVGPETVPGGEDTYISYGRGWANVSNTPYREYKHWVHEGGIATPLIVHWPDGIDAQNEWRDQPTHLIDVTPTLLELAGAEHPVSHRGQPTLPLEGVSLIPSFRNSPVPRAQPLCWEHEGNRAIRLADSDGDWKLVAKNRKPWELYELSVDRTESRDLAAEQTKRVESMARLWQQWADRVGCVEFGSWNQDRKN